jgi:Tfp pilus assembly protein FimV
MRLYAATSQHYVRVTVHPGDTLWSIASSHSAPSADVQEVVDRISAANRIAGGALQPGQHLRIPQ